jgi:hypothetical protein
MATYSDSMAGYADFRSTGRYFALAAAASALIGASAVYTGSGHLPSVAHTSSDLVFAAMAGYVFLGLSLLMAIAVLGSLLISTRGKQTITVSQLGVFSKTRGKELFLAREEILGIAETPGNRTPRGGILVTADSARRLLIPRWIGGYAECLEEIQKLGVPTLPPYRRTRKRIIVGRLGHALVLCGGVLVILAARPPFSLQRVGLGGLALVVIARIFLAMQRYSNRFDGGLERT